MKKRSILRYRLSSISGVLHLFKFRQNTIGQQFKNDPAVLKHSLNFFRVVSLPFIFIALSINCSAQQNPANQTDGQHDFDFNIGRWKTHISRLVKPLTGSKAWNELDGFVTVRKVWDGRSQVEEIEADGTAGHFEGLTLFLYNPQSRQWSMSFANSNDGIIDQPSIGGFKDGRGEFFQQAVYNGRSIAMTAPSVRH